MKFNVTADFYYHTLFFKSCQLFFELFFKSYLICFWFNAPADFYYDTRF